MKLILSTDRSPVYERPLRAWMKRLKFCRGPMNTSKCCHSVPWSSEIFFSMVYKKSGFQQGFCKILNVVLKFLQND